MKRFKNWLNATQTCPPQDRPLVTLSYAQSLDGCLTVNRGQHTKLSDPAAMRLTHMLRASHEAILIGIGTVLVDNPQLNNRLVPGSSPQPIILDTYLRTPLTSRLMQRDDQMPWIFSGSDIDTIRRGAYVGKGAGVFICAEERKGYLNLLMIMHYLNKMGVRSIMVEGGSRVISSFLRCRLVDRAVITLAPVWLAGLPVLEREMNRNQIVFPSGYPRLAKPFYQHVGTNVVACGLIEDSGI